MWTDFNPLDFLLLGSSLHTGNIKSSAGYGSSTRGSSKRRFPRTATLRASRHSRKHPEAIAIASEHLVAVVPDSTNSNGKRVVSDEPDKIPIKKRKRHDFCVQCKEEFDVNDNSVEACIWHKGTPYSSNPIQKCIADVNRRARSRL